MATVVVEYAARPINSVTLTLSQGEAENLMKALELMGDYPFNLVSPIAANLRRVLRPVGSQSEG